MAFTCHYPSPKFSVEENAPSISLGRENIETFCPVFQIFRKLAIGLISFSPVLECLMETSCLESHENKRELGGYCCSEDLQWTETLVAWWPLFVEGGKKKSGVCIQCSAWVASFFSVSLDSKWRLSPAHSRSFETPWNQSWLVWGNEETCSTAQTNSRENKRKLAHSSIGNLA